MGGGSGGGGGGGGGAWNRDSDRKASNGSGSKPARVKRRSDMDRHEDSKRTRPSSVNVSAASRPRPPSGDAGTSGKSCNGPLPPNWEKHWSTKYGICYFWNRKNDKASWEKPTH